MDTPTTVALGATVGIALHGRRGGAGAVVLCATASLLPDLDGVIAGNTLEFIRFHRGPSHSLLVLALATPLAAGLARWCGARRASYGWLCAAAATGFAIAVGTDLITWWGTVVLWPFLRARVGVGVVFIIDLWLTAIALSPFLVWAVQRVRSRGIPWRAFQIASVLACLYVGGCLLARVSALRALEAHAAASGARPVDVFPQPLSPLRWSLVADQGDAYTLGFLDLAGDGQVHDRRRFARNDQGAGALCDATPTGRTLLWFYRLPVREIHRGADGTTEVVYRDLAYELTLPSWLQRRLGPPPIRSAPFRYRFLVRDGAVVEEGWVSGSQ